MVQKSWEVVQSQDRNAAVVVAAGGRDPLGFVFQPAGWSHVRHGCLDFAVGQCPASLPHSQPAPLS